MTGLNDNTRTAKNWDLRKMGKTQIFYDGKTFESVTALANYLGVARDTLSARIHRQHAPEAMWGLPSLKNTPSQDHKGRQFKNMKDMAKHWGLPYKCLINRLACGWDIKKALTTKVQARPRKAAAQG